MTNRGGARPGSGRKRIGTEKLVTIAITIFPADKEYLLSINRNISKAIRSIIAAERELTALERNRNDDNADCQ